jgi:hypothetical protein
MVLIFAMFQHLNVSLKYHYSEAKKFSFGNNAIFFFQVKSRFFFIHLFKCAYIAWVISPPCPPHFQAEPVLPLSLILLKRRHKYN